MAVSQGVELAYKYPFLGVAKEIIAEMNRAHIELRYLDAAKKHLKQALDGNLTYVPIRLDSARKDYLMTYLYSRMLVSAIGRIDVVNDYVSAERNRSLQALRAADVDEVMAVAEALGVRLTNAFSLKGKNSVDLAIGFADFLASAPEGKEFELSNQKLGKGVIALSKANASRIVCEAARGEMLRGLPIDRRDLPARLIEYSKTVRLAYKTKEITAPRGVSRTWIDRLMKTPIPDVRHRTVNLILAPYLVNTRGMSVDDAVKVIDEYVARCKRINPDTNVNETYIRYQCNYAKRRGLKPLTYARAKELIGEFLESENSNDNVKDEIKKS